MVVNNNNTDSRIPTSTYDNKYSNTISYNVDSTAKDSQSKQLNSKSKSLHLSDYKLSIDKTATERTSRALQSDDKNNILAQFATFVKPTNFIYSPSTLSKHIDRSSRSLIDSISSDRVYAKDFIMLVVSKLVNSSMSQFRNMSEEYLSNFIFGKSNGTTRATVRNVISVCKRLGIVICDNKFEMSVKAYGYRLSDDFIDNDIVKYKLLSQKAIESHRRHYYERLSAAYDNIIAKNIFKIYETISIPSEQELRVEAKRLIKNKHKTKKGKTLKFRNGKSKKLDNHELFSYIEDNIKRFKILSEDGFMIPKITGATNGRRIVDSFSLMPSWIRNLCKLDGERIEEADYTALHPNIAIKIYRGKSTYLTHQKVAEIANIEVSDVKLNHLSFFNQEIWQMMQNPLYDFYQKNENDLVRRIMSDKKYDYKRTSVKMFCKEVEIMTEVVKRLNAEKIYVGYIYDALFASNKNIKRVTEVMNKVILEYGVKTTAK